MRGDYRVDGSADRDWDLRARLEGLDVKAVSSARRMSIGRQGEFAAHGIHPLQVAVLKPDGSDAYFGKQVPAQGRKEARTLWEASGDRNLCLTIAISSCEGTR